eukprot:GHVT01065520.1.p2 GENE.GHVT01065520.1~~GHVT01065520.1.p2  ORF type:complete len:551 (+),score=24.64 GHVT01065520.1:351-2003(+)
MESDESASSRGSVGKPAFDPDKAPLDYPRLRGLEVVVFHPCDTEADFHNPKSVYSPLFTHHFFGEREVVVGYDELTIRIFYATDTFQTFCKYESQLSPNLSALDRRAVSEYLEYCMNGRTAFPGGFVGSQAEFLKHMRQRKKKSFKPPGVVVGEQFLDNGTRQSKVRTSPKIVGAVPPSELFQLRECRFSPDDSEFNSLHRRMEWFLHWFIESASPIDHDERWRVLLPYIVRHKSNIDIPMPSIKEAKENRIAARPSKSAAKKRGRSTDVEQNEMHGETDVESRHITWHLAGISTTYTFFTIGKDRRRISQFMVLPHMQGKGIGGRILEYISIKAALDDSVCEVTVEDPAPSFKQLRDVISLKVCFDSGELPRECLYPEDYARQAAKRSSHLKYHETGYIPQKKDFVQIVKESPKQCTRMQEIIRLARIMPHPPPDPPAVLFLHNDPRDDAGSSVSRDWRAAVKEVDIPSQNDSFSGSEECQEVRLIVKRRLLKEHLDALTTVKCGSVRFGPSRRDQYKEYVKTELQRMWKEYYCCYYRTIRKLRCIFPL